MGFCNTVSKFHIRMKGGESMGWFHQLCLYCDLKPGFWSTGYMCKYKCIDLDEKSDLFKFGCDGGPTTGPFYCPFYQKK